MPSFGIQDVQLRFEEADRHKTTSEKRGFGESARIRDAKQVVGQRSLHAVGTTA